MFRARSSGLAFLAVLATLASIGASAQVYRIVGPDGKVTFSDKPPADNRAPATRAPSVEMPGNGGGGSLPFELRTASGKYPVTLYTGEGCGSACASARSYLASRGVPYTEKTISTNEDAVAFRKLSGEMRVPFLTVGSQQLRGYSETEWTQYLDAAGYPKTSQLPSSYRNPPPAPLVAVQQAPAQAAAAPAAPQQPQVQQPSLEPTAPGIRF